MKRNIVSLVIGVSFLVILVTGILMYFQPFQTPIAALHTTFGLLFLIGALFHIWNNLKPLKKYATDRKSKLVLSKPFLSIIPVLCAIAYFTYFGIFGFNSIYDWGNKYRSQQLGKELISKDFEFITLTKPIGDYTIELEGKKGDSFKYPMFAAWAEDTLGNYIKTVYVSNTIGTSIYAFKKGVKGQHIIRRPSGLPVWAHRRNIIAEDGLMIPLGKAPDLDGYTGATPLKDFVIQSQTDLDQYSAINIFFEVNQSYDWNEYYSKDRFPNDSIYTKLGQSGQPSLVFGTRIDFRSLKNKKSYVLRPMGHGHHSGANGTLYKDLTNITTAFNIVERFIITIYDKKSLK